MIHKIKYSAGFKGTRHRIEALDRQVVEKRLLHVLREDKGAKIITIPSAR